MFLINNMTLQNLLLISAYIYPLIKYLKSDNQLKDVTLKKLDVVLKTWKERDLKVEGIAKMKINYESIINFVKRNLE